MYTSYVINPVQRQGVGGYLTKFNIYGDAPPQGPTPYPFIYRFGRKGTSLIYLLLTARPGAERGHCFTQSVFIFFNRAAIALRGS